MSCRRLTERDPDLRAPAVDTRRETGDPLRDGYAVLNRAKTDWRGQQVMPSYLKPDRSDEMFVSVSMYED